jgi:hypothetical protein
LLLLDCFASLAMTEQANRVAAPKPRKLHAGRD